MQTWLAEPGSLTLRLRKAVGQGFGVQLLEQCWARPFAGEALLLELPRHRRTLVREVLLHCQGSPLVLARTVMPPRTLRGARCGLAKLGNRPLGEVLFAQRGLRRSHLEWARLVQPDWLASVAENYPLAGPVWGRRSLYEVEDAALTVCEFFLPAVLLLPETAP